MISKVFTPPALLAAQNKFAFQFPPDVFDLLVKSGIPGGYDWECDDEKISGMFEWPFDGLLFDIENNGLWWPEWGPRPSEQADRAAVLSRAVRAAPRLIPLFSHRFIPESPRECGNPIFSVYQSDIIVYGQNLSDWIYHEFKIGTPQPGANREISFWTQAVNRSGDPSDSPFRQDD